MPALDQNLTLNRCPHCNVDHPNLEQRTLFDTHAHDRTNQRYWGIYVCRRCGGVITASGAPDPHYGNELRVIDIFPSPISIDESLPERAKAYLQQAIQSINAPSGAIMLAASSIDSMLKIKGYTSGNLYSRIGKAAEDHLITQSMADWAHEVRLEANDQRHADDEAELPGINDAQRIIEFTMALAQFLFVLPSRVEKGIKQAKGEPSTALQPPVAIPRASTGR